MATKLYSYIRMSTEQQLREGDSLRRQLAKTQEFADKLGLEMDESTTFQDLGVSSYRGKNFKDGALGQLMAMVNEGLIPEGSYLAMESFDRFSRMEPLNVLSKFIEIVNSGINLVTLIDGQVYSKETISENYILLMGSLTHMQLAHDESKKKSQRLSASWDNKRAMAQNSGKKLTKKCPGWMTLNKSTNEFELIPERVKIVELMFQMAIDGLGKRKIAEHLNKTEVPTFGKSQFWHSTYVTKVLDSRSVLGELQLYKFHTIDGERKRLPDGEPISDYYPRIISDETFYAAKAAINSRAQKGGRRGRQYSNIFSGIAVCGQCTTSLDKVKSAQKVKELESDPNFLALDEESQFLEVGKATSRHTPMTFINKGKHGEQYLFCEGARRKSGCDNIKYWNYHYLEESILTFCNHLDLTDAFSSPSSSRIDPFTRLVAEEEEVKNRKAKLESDANKLLDLYLNGGSLVQQRLTDIQNEIDSLQVRLDKISKEKINLEGRKIDREEFTKTMSDLFNFISTDEPNEETFARRAKIASLLRRVVSKIEIFSDGRFMDGQREFVIHYHNGEKTAVIPNPNNGREYRIILERDKMGNILREDRVSLN